jgi:hypothetical protein
MQAELPEDRALLAADSFAAAMLARDFDAIGALLAADVVVTSPITASFRFRGRDDVLELLRVVREVIEGIEYSPHIAAGNAAALNFRGRVGDVELEGVDLLRLDDDGAVKEFTVFIRPLAGVTALMAALGPPLARPRGRWRAVAIRVLAGPLALLTRRSDRLGARLAGRIPEG